jgi:hypothetical protein
MRRKSTPTFDSTPMAAPMGTPNSKFNGTPLGTLMGTPTNTTPELLPHIGLQLMICRISCGPLQQEELIPDDPKFIRNRFKLVQAITIWKDWIKLYLSTFSRHNWHT